MFGIIFVYVDTVFGFYWHSFFMLNWMFQHDYLDTCFFAHLVCVFCIFVFAPVQRKSACFT